MTFNEKLIALVKQYKFLYDLNDRKYSDTQRKDAAWKIIAKKLDTQEKNCKRSWGLLRDAYRRAIKKQKEKHERNGDSVGPIRKWKYEEEMSFLLPYLKERTIVREECSDADDSSDNLFRTSENLDELAAMKRTKFVGANYQTTPNFDAQSNDIQKFFDSVAATVQTFPLRDRAVAKARVFSVISEMEMDILSRDSYHCVESPVTEFLETQIDFNTPSPKLSDVNSDAQELGDADIITIKNEKDMTKTLTD